MELLEEICNDMQDYGENRDPESTGRKYIRYKNRLQEKLDLPHINISDGIKKSLEVAVSIKIEFCTKLEGGLSFVTHHIKTKQCCR